MDNFPIVEVVWLDSVRQPAWVDVQESRDEHEDFANGKHYTCGYLVKKDRHGISVALCRSESYQPDSSPTVGMVMTIPKGAVLSFRRL